MREMPQVEIPIRHRDDGEPDGPARPLPGRSGMVLLFEEWAAKAPDRAAVVDREGTVSYGELNAAADLLARRLIEAGAGSRHARDRGAATHATVNGRAADRTARAIGSPAAGGADRATGGAGGASVAGRTDGTTPGQRANGTGSPAGAPAPGDATAGWPAGDAGYHAGATVTGGTAADEVTYGTGGSVTGSATGHRAEPVTSGATGHRAEPVSGSATDHRAAPVTDGTTGHRAAPVTDGTTGQNGEAVADGAAGTTFAPKSSEMSTGGHGGAAGEVVAILAGRTAGTMAGMLAAMKAGAAYLPLDPEYPASRLELVLRDSGARTVLVPDGLRERLPAFDGTVLELPVFGKSQTPDMARTAAG
ncbi:hypothetical protein GCM10027203_62450 [Nonomuraea fastidiosa]